MGTKLNPTDVAGNYSVDTTSVQTYHLEKQAWQEDRAMQGNPTADVERATEAGGDASAGVQPTYTAVSGLSGLRVFADSNLKQYERKWGGLVEQANRVFIFYDVTDSITQQDLIKYDGDRYEVMNSDFDDESGRVEVLAKIVRSDV